jgi:hypothetical protein
LVWHELLRSRADVALIVAAVIALGESSDSVGGLLDAISWPTGRDRDSERRK